MQHLEEMAQVAMYCEKQCSIAEYYTDVHTIRPMGASLCCHTLIAQVVMLLTQMVCIFYLLSET